MRFGMPVPDRIANAPELDMGLGLYYQGFLDLTSCRQVGMGLGPISSLAVFDYCWRNDIAGEQLEDFLWLIPRLDAKYLEWARGRSNATPIQPQDRANGGPDSGQRRPPHANRRPRR